MIVTYIKRNIESGCNATSFYNSNSHLEGILTKSLKGSQINYICNKLGAYDMYALE